MTFSTRKLLPENNLICMYTTPKLAIYSKHEHRHKSIRLWLKDNSKWISCNRIAKCFVVLIWKVFLITKSEVFLKIFLTIILFKNSVVFPRFSMKFFAQQLQVKNLIVEKTSQDASDEWLQCFSFQSTACCMVRASEATWGASTLSVKYSLSEEPTQWSTH